MSADRQLEPYRIPVMWTRGVPLTVAEYTAGPGKHPVRRSRRTGHLFRGRDTGTTHTEGLMKFGFVLTATVLAASAPAAAQSRTSDSAAVAFPSGERAALARRWLDTYNGGDVAAYRKFMEANAESGGTPIDARVERYGEMQQNLGKLTILGATETPDGIELKVRTGHGDEGTVTVMISRAAPFKFQAVRVEI